MFKTYSFLVTAVMSIMFLLISTSFHGKFDLPEEIDDILDSLKRNQKKTYQEIFEEGDKWVDSVMISMTEEEKIAQLFMVAAYSNKDQAHVLEIEKLVRDYGIGGLIFFQGGPVRQAKLCNGYQKLAKVPLMISIDGEWGLAMRLDSTISYPRQMMLGAVENNNLIYQMGKDIASQCKRMGIHVNLAPVVDVNNNPKNPVINSRSFGEDKINVAEKSVAYMQGMQDQNVLATAKHFPGHGDTDTDSHKALPVISHPKSRLEDIELYPFKQLIEAGTGGMMVAHLYIPSLDSTLNTASTLSKPIVTDLLKKEMGFKGLTFTDALNMKGVSSYYAPGEVDLKALMAGNDVLLFAEDVPLAIKKIRDAIKQGKITQNEIDHRCKKIIQVKKWVGLNKYKDIDINNLINDLNKPEFEFTKRELIKKSITLVKNEHALIPLKKLDTLKIASVAIGETKVNSFQKMMDKYAEVTHFRISANSSEEDQIALMKKIQGFNLIVVGVHNTNRSPSKNFGVTGSAASLIAQIRGHKKAIVALFANPYSLKKCIGSEDIETLVVSYNDTKLSNEYTAQLIFGGIQAKGRLPVSVEGKFPSGTGIETSDAIRFEYTQPEAVGISTAYLDSIDTIAIEGVKDKAYPGCVVLVAKEGKVIYEKAFGYHTYENKTAVRTDDIYDLASITKIAASIPSAMKMKDENKFSLDYNLCDYVPELVDSSEEYMNLNLRAILAHQSGLVSWIPFYQATMNRGKPKFELYSLDSSAKYPYRVADDFFINREYTDTIYNRIINTSLKSPGDYKYSDLGYYFMKRIIENSYQTSLDLHVSNTFYKPLGMTTTGYHPRWRFSLDRIPPTEYDMNWRKQLVHGDVHDPGAAMMGGVGGHAGLFSSANDLAKLMYMYLNWGEYGGERYISESTLREFTDCQFCDNNRRGAGFDKPVRGEGGGPTCNSISYNSFGHSGFTGTIAWADPDEKVVYIFLSNRVYPDSRNVKLLKSGIRTRIMSQIYNAIESAKTKSS